MTNMLFLCALFIASALANNQVALSRQEEEAICNPNCIPGYTCRRCMDGNYSCMSNSVRACCGCRNGQCWGCSSCDWCDVSRPGQCFPPLKAELPVVADTKFALLPPGVVSGSGRFTGYDPENHFAGEYLYYVDSMESRLAISAHTTPDNMPFRLWGFSSGSQRITKLAASFLTPAGGDCWYLDTTIANPLVTCVDYTEDKFPAGLQGSMKKFGIRCNLDAVGSSIFDVSWYLNQANGTLTPSNMGFTNVPSGSQWAYIMSVGTMGVRNHVVDRNNSAFDVPPSCKPYPFV